MAFRYPHVVLLIRNAFVQRLDEAHGHSDLLDKCNELSKSICKELERVIIDYETVLWSGENPDSSELRSLIGKG